MSGFVYLATNESMKDLVKIGMTDKPVDERMAELSAETGVPTRFICRFSLNVDNPREIEKRLHILFQYCRTNKKREFFKVDWQIVMIALLLFADKSSDESVEEIQTVSSKKAQIQKLSSDTKKQESQTKDEQYKENVDNTDLFPELRTLTKEQTCKKYEEYVRSTTDSPTTADDYHRTLLYLGENHIHENIYDIKSVQKAQRIRDRLLDKGDLSKFNIKFQDRAMSAAIGKYVQFLRSEQYKEYACQYAIKTITKKVAVIDHKALVHLGKTHIHKNIYDMVSVENAQAIKDRLLQGGDLWEFDQKYSPKGSMSAAIGKYIEFLKFIKKNEK